MSNFLLFHVVEDNYYSISLKEVEFIAQYDEETVNYVTIEGTLENEAVILLIDELEVYSSLLMWYEGHQGEVRIQFKAQQRLVRHLSEVWQEQSELDPLELIIDRPEDKLTPLQQFKFYDINYHSVIHNEGMWQIHCQESPCYTMGFHPDVEKKMDVFYLEVMLDEDEDGIITDVKVTFSVDEYYYSYLEQLFGADNLTDSPTNLIVILSLKPSLVDEFNSLWRQHTDRHPMEIFYGLNELNLSPFRYVSNYELKTVLSQNKEIFNEIKDSANAFYLTCSTKKDIQILTRLFEVTIITHNNIIIDCYLKFNVPYLYLIEEIQPLGILTEIQLTEQQNKEIITDFVQAKITMIATENLVDSFNANYPTFPLQSPLTFFNKNTYLHNIESYELMDYQLRYFK